MTQSANRLRLNKNMNHGKYWQIVSNKKPTRRVRKSQMNKRRLKLVEQVKKNMKKIIDFIVTSVIVHILNSMRLFIKNQTRIFVSRAKLIGRSRKSSLSRTVATHLPRPAHRDSYSSNNEGTAVAVPVYFMMENSSVDLNWATSDRHDDSLSSSKVNEEVEGIFKNSTPSITSLSDESDDGRYYYDVTDKKFKRQSDIDMCHYFLSLRQEHSLGDEYSSKDSDSHFYLPSSVPFNDKSPDDSDYNDDVYMQQSTKPMPIARPGFPPSDNFPTLDNENRSLDVIGQSDTLRLRHWHDTFALDKSMLYLQVGCRS